MPGSAFRVPLISAGGSLAFALLLFAGSNDAYACEVLSLPSVQEAYDNSDAIFSGRIVDFQKSTIEGVDKRIAFFEADRYWKSPDGNDYKELIVTTAIDHGACGFDFEVGKHYLVYASTWSDTDFLSTSIGTRTDLIEDRQEDLAFLGEGQPPTKELGWNEQLGGLQVQPIPTEQEHSPGEEWETAHTIGKFLYSEPPKPDQIFKVYYRVINGTIGSINVNEGVTATNVSSIGDAGTLEVMFPRNYPYTNQEITDGRNAIVFFNDETIPNTNHHFTADDCFFVFSVPFAGNDNAIHVGWEKLLWTKPHHGDDVPESCMPQTVAGAAPSPQELQMCGELDIALEECNQAEILQKRAIVEDRKRFEEQQNQINTAMYMIGVGAAIASVFAFLTLRKRK